MMWRRMLLQATVCMIGGAIVVLGWFVYRHTNSEAVRRQVVDNLQNRWPNVTVEIGSAWIRPLGGISVRDLRITHRDDPTHDLVRVPIATIYHDKQQLTHHGRLVIRKIELQEPRLHLSRRLDGRWNTESLSNAQTGGSCVPTIVVRQGTIEVDTGSSVAGRKSIEISELNWTLIQSEADVVEFNGRCKSPLGPITMHGRRTGPDGVLAACVELPEVQFTPAANSAISLIQPDLQQHLSGLQGRGAIRVDLSRKAGVNESLQPEIAVTLNDCRFQHPRLPVAMERIQLQAQVRNGTIQISNCKAWAGATEFRLQLDARLPDDAAKTDDIESLVNRLDLNVTRLTLSPELFERLPPSLAALDRRFRPSGPISLTYKIERRDRAWSKRLQVQAEGLQATYHGFPYPTRDLRGTLDQYSDNTGADRLKVDLIAAVGDRIATIQGESGGDSPNAWMDLTIRCNDLPVDETLLHALGKNRTSIERFHPQGTIDLVATVRQKPGETDTNERFLVHFRNLSVRYDAFPYPLEQVTGTMDITTAAETRVELRQVRGQHHGGEIRVSGKNVSGPSGSVIRLNVNGAGVPLDHDVVRAMAAIKLDDAWKTLSPRGRAAFSAQLTYVERATPAHVPSIAPELEVQFDQLHFDSLTPEFFPYELSDVHCTLKYGRDQLTIANMQGRHGATQLRIGPTLLIVKPEGGMWARIRRLQMMPLVPDDDLLRALPAGLRSAAQALEPNGPISLDTDLLVVDLAPAKHNAITPRVASNGRRPTVRASGAALQKRDEMTTWLYWENASLTFTGATVKLGITWDQVYGEFSSRGEYRHGELGAVEGNFLCKSARILKQPVQNVHAKLLIDPGVEPGVLKVKNFRAQVYGGDFGGEGRIQLDPFEYRLSFKGVQLRLEEIAKQNRLGGGADLSGLASVQIALSGVGSDLKNLRGSGTFDVPRGKIYNLPLLLDLLKFVKLRAPDGTAFEEAHGTFSIHGKRLHFDEIELLGNLISLTGNGDVQLDTMRAHLDIYTVWSRLVQLLPGPGKEISNAISRNLFRIELDGSLDGAVDFRQQAIPVLIDPVRRLLDRMREPPPRRAP
jgi:hypothetical protein